MLKIFTTQLFGVFRNIQEKNEETIEDCSRLIAQTVTAGGNIYLKGFDELGAVTTAAIVGDEKLPSVAPYNNEMSLGPTDCLLIFTKTSDDPRLEEMLAIAHRSGASFITVGAIVENEELINKDFHIDTTLVQGLVPTETGDRSGYPTVMCGLYIYHALVFNTLEMLEEYND
ncbi:DUF2529 domain-containing protein [Pseudalkalibacillus decolorationis]|uniref:DUF2529 domain-containing protein n=1 Tax=Pseudalkalibacillus decolorationis TaxID=163879 RepID=UPI002147582A|nr:DUF2529 domain-containing protein [Pseudalkalibacillus decolorationis]